LTEKPKLLVIDTNTLMSALIFRNSAPWLAVVFAFTNGKVLSSSATRNELRDVVRRTKFDRYVLLQNRLQATEDIIENMIDVQIRERFSVCRDAKDDKILELAVNGRATVIITGDKDLLVLHPFRGIAILTPANYLAL
jgi:putative PIN family toxin of toxin-antitoxin system